MYGADALGAEGTLDNNFRLRKRRACATYGNRAAKWTVSHSSETLYFNTMWTWHTDTGLPDGQYSKHIYLGETRVVTKQTSKLEASYGQSDEWHHQYYYHPDHLGSAQLITDYEGNEYQRIEYTPCGELWVEKKTEKEEGLRYLPYKFTAKEQDEETGLYYYGARYLDAKYSRWLSADPAVSDYVPQAGSDNAKLPAGGVYDFINLNLYHYAGNNPIKYIDPTGNFKLPKGYFNNFNKTNMADLVASSGKTHCNDFIPRFLKGLGDKVYNDIIPKKENASANDLYNSWESNPSMINLNDLYAKTYKDAPNVNIQEAAADLATYYADEGYLVLAVASEGGNHVAVVAPSNLTYECNPSLPKVAKYFEGTSGLIPHQGSRKPIVTRDYPVFIQAGTYTGVVPPGWAFSRTMFDKGQVQFYVYKPQKEQ